jgi:hypothetical protein
VSAIVKLTQRIALFQSIEYPGTPCAWSMPEYEGGPGDAYCPSGYVRVSEVMVVEFAPLADGDVVAAQVAELRRHREKVVQEFSEKLAAIDGRVASLQAITHQVES